MEPASGSCWSTLRRAPANRRSTRRRRHDLWARSLSGGGEWALTNDGEPDYHYGSGPDCTSNGTLLRKLGLPHLPPAVAWSPDSTKVLTHRTDERRVRQTRADLSHQHLHELRHSDVPELVTWSVQARPMHPPAAMTFAGVAGLF